MSFEKLRILPLLIFVATLAFSVRLADTILGVYALSGQAYAADDKVAGETKDQRDAGKKEGSKSAKEPPPPDVVILPNPDALVGSMDADKKGALQFPDLGGPATPAVPDAKTGDTKAADTKTDAKPAEKKSDCIGWQDAGDIDVDYSKSRSALAEDLAKRRADLEQREKEMQTKEALLKAGEQQLDHKFQELTQLRGEIEKLLQTQSEEEDARVASLVKIYEGMKPADAARIFDTLDIDVLVQVVSKMSERKLSPVMAAMNAERAKTITTMLAQQKQLPTLPPVN